MTINMRIGRFVVPVTAVPLHASSLQSVLSFGPFVAWKTRMDQALSITSTNFDVRSVHVTDIDWFGNRIGFVKFHVGVYVGDEQIPGIVFCRGDSVAVLLIVRKTGAPRNTDERWVVLVVQPRIPIGMLEEPALPAGMLDGENNFAGVASREIHEECGLTIEASDLVPLHPEGLHPSAGGCDEHVRLFVCEKEMDAQDIEKMHGRVGGLHGEKITLRLVPLQELSASTNDLKAHAALGLYRARFG